MANYTHMLLSKDKFRLTAAAFLTIQRRSLLKFYFKYKNIYFNTHFANLLILTYSKLNLENYKRTISYHSAEFVDSLFEYKRYWSMNDRVNDTSNCENTANYGTNMH